MESNRRVQYWAALVVSLATMTNGAAFFWVTATLPRFHNHEIIVDITSSEISWMVSIMPMGLVIGSIIASYISDNFGRRATLSTSALPHIIGTVLVLYAKTTWMLYIGRVLWGCGVGLILTVSSIYLSEIADKEIRGFLTLMTRLTFSIGVMIVLFIGSYASYQVLTGTLIAFPTCYFLACWWIPESPYFLLKEGKVNAAKKALLQLGGYIDEKVQSSRRHTGADAPSTGILHASEESPTITTIMIVEKLTLMRSDVTKEMARSGSVKELLTGKRYRKAVIICAGLRVTQLLAGVIPIQQYLGRIIEQSNCGIDISVSLITFGVVRFAGCLIAPMIVDRVGRRPLLMYSYLATSIVLAVVGFYFFMQLVIGIKNESTNPFRFIVFIGNILSCTIANIGYNSLIYVIPSEMFPLNVKAIAITVINIFAAVLNFIVVRGYQIMEDFAGLYGVFWFYAMMSFTGVVFTYFVIPETKGKSLREIQIELQGNIYNENNERSNQVKEANDSLI